MTLHLPNIVLVGKIGSGKTAVSDYLQAHHGYERMSFAAPLKKGCATNDDRALLQKVGHGVRELYPDFWVNLFVDAFERLPNGPAHRIVVDDCRYPNEAQRLAGEGFVFIRISAPRNTRLLRAKAAGRLQDEAQLDDISERSLDEYQADHRIVNDGAWLPDLHAQVVQILNLERR